MSGLTTIVCRSMDPSLRRTLTLFLTEVAPLTFCGVLNARVRTELWNRLGDRVDVHEITCVYPDPTQEGGFSVMANDAAAEYVEDLDGALVGVRRVHGVQQWERILGKTRPGNYPLVRHLLDTAAVAEVLMEMMLSKQQMSTIAAGFTVNDDEADKDRRVRDFVRYVAGMHDIGKATSHWQRNTLKFNETHHSLVDEHGKLLLPMPALSEDLADHGMNGQYYFLGGHSVVPFREEDPSLVNTHNTIRRIIAGHHGVFQEVLDAFNAKFDEEAKEGNPGQPWVEAQNSIEECVLDTLGVSAEDILDCSFITQETTVLVTGVVILADWIASTEDFIEGVDLSNYDYRRHYQDSVQRARSIVDQHGLHKPSWKPDLKWLDIFPHFSSPNALQKSLVKEFDRSDHGSGILLISAPMGSGKTEASLYVGSLMSQRAGGSGLWINLPTKVTSDAMFIRATEIAQRIFEGDEYSVALMHSDAAFSTAVESVSTAAELRNRKRLESKAFFDKDAVQPHISEHDVDATDDCGLPTNVFISEYLLEKRVGGMSSIAVGTIDQAIKASLRMKHNALRWLAVSGKTVILDEIHDYDAYTFTLIKRFVEWCGEYRIPVIAMSATLSGTSQRELLQAYHRNSGLRKNQLKEQVELAVPDISGIPSPSWVYMPDAHTVKQDFTILEQKHTPYRTTVHSAPSFVGASIPVVEDVMDNGGTILCVCNTVKQAVGLYEHLKARFPEPDLVGLVHSRMPQERRQEVVADLLERTGKATGNNAQEQRKPYILVSTQVVQQSMDIDFDVLITALAPLPELFQRIGRIYRHDQGDRRAESYRGAPQVHIMVEEGVTAYRDGIKRFPLAESTNASFIPYNAEMTKGTVNPSWGSLSALEVLHHELGFSYGVPCSWDAKERIQECFAAYTDLFDKAKSRSTGYPIMDEAFWQEQEAVDNLTSTAGKVVIRNPLARKIQSSWRVHEVTSVATDRSPNRPATRMIDETKTVLPVWGSVAEGYYLDPALTEPVPVTVGKRSLEEMRLIGLKVISVPRTTYDRMSELDDTSISALPEHIIPIHFDAIEAASLGYTKEKGLVDEAITSDNYTWL